MVLFLFQAIILWISIRFNQDKILLCNQDIKEHFWRYEDFDLKVVDKNYFHRIVKTLNIMSKVLLYSTYMVVPLFYLSPLFFGGEQPFKAYQPSWMTLRQLLLLQVFVLAIALIPLLVSTINSFMVYCVLTKLQYRLISIEIERLFGSENYLNYQDFKQVVDHYNFLIR